MLLHDLTHEYSDDCKGCQPCLQDQVTGEVIPDDDPKVVAMRKAFYEGCTLEERRAYHRAVFQSSTNPHDRAAAEKVARRMVDAMGGVFDRWAKPGEVEANQAEFQKRKEKK